MMSRGVKAANKLRALVADHRGKPVVRAKRIGGGARAGLLSQAEIHSAHDLALFIEILQRHFHAAVHHHPAVELYALFLIQIPGIPYGRDRRIQVAAYFVMNFRSIGNFNDFKFGLLQSPIGNAVLVRADRRNLVRSTPIGGNADFHCFLPGAFC